MLSDWQEIDNAPRDRHILACWQSWGIKGLTVYGVVKWEYTDWIEGDCEVVGEPTHWMPLPEPPNNKQPETDSPAQS